MLLKIEHILEMTYQDKRHTFIYVRGTSKLGYIPELLSFNLVFVPVVFILHSALVTEL